MGLDVTVSREDWHLAYGAEADPVADLADTVARYAAASRRLCELAGTTDGVPYRVIGSGDKTHPDVAARGFLTVRAAVALTVDHRAWETRYGLPAAEGIAAHAAAEAAAQPALSNELTGTVQVVPYSAGWIIREDTMRPGRPQ